MNKISNLNLHNMQQQVPQVAKTKKLKQELNLF